MKHILEYNEFVNEISKELSVRIENLKYDERKKEIENAMREMTPEQKEKAKIKLMELRRKLNQAISDIKRK